MATRVYCGNVQVAYEHKTGREVQERLRNGGMRYGRRCCIKVCEQLASEPDWRAWETLHASYWIATNVFERIAECVSLAPRSDGLSRAAQISVLGFGSSKEVAIGMRVDLPTIYGISRKACDL